MSESSQNQSCSLPKLTDSEPARPFLVMSGYAADSPGHSAGLPPEAAFLPKPFTPAVSWTGCARPWPAEGPAAGGP